MNQNSKVVTGQAHHIYNSEVAATTKVEEAQGWDKDYSLHYWEYLENDGVHDGRLKIKALPPKRREPEGPQLLAHLLQPQAAHLLPHIKHLFSNHPPPSLSLFVFWFGLLVWNWTQGKGCMRLPFIYRIVWCPTLYI